MKLVILDRDGVINQDSDTYIKSPEEWLPLDGSLEAIARLGKAGFKIVVATNQSGIARKLFDEFTLARIHQKMISLAESHGGFIDAVFYCPHGPDEGCNCRKPKTGMLEEIAVEFGVDLAGVPFVGDSLKDLQAAERVGCIPYLVRTGKGKQTLTNLKGSDFSEVVQVADLDEASRLIIQQCR